MIINDQEILLNDRYYIGNLKLSLVNILGGFIFGYNSGVIAGVLNLPEWKSQTALDKSILTCSLLVGAMIGSLLAGWLIDALGRKKPMAITSILCIVGCIGSALVPENLWYIVIFRLILGISVGISAVVCPTYVGEMANSEKKGALGTLFQIAITVGIFISDVIGFALQNIKYNYRVMFVLGLLPGVLLLFLVPLIPESVKWVESKYVSLSQSKPSPKSLGLKEILKSPIGRFAMFIGVILAINNQLTGINAFMYFSPSIFEKAGITSGNGPMFATIGLVGWNAITTFISTFLIDKIGKRKLMLYGSLIMTGACLALAVLFLLVKGEVLGVLSIILLFTFILGFEIGAGPLFWIYVTEIFPQEMKDTGSSVLNATQWIFNIALSFSFLQLVTLIGQAAIFFIFGGIGVVCLFILYFKLEENSNKKDYQIIY